MLKGLNQQKKKVVDLQLGFWGRKESQFRLW